MNKNTLHFLVWLVLLTAAVAWIWWRIPVAVAPGDGGFKGYLLLHQLVYLLFVLTPLLAVLITEKWRLKQIIRQYRLTLCGIDVKKAVFYSVFTAIAFPVLIVALVLFFANVLGVSGAGKIVPQNWTTLLIAFVWAITVGWLGALPGEIAWRGFLEHNVTVTRFGKYCFIGLVWGVWNLPVVAFVAAGQSMGERIAYMGCVLLMCVICSFYYASALHRTRTLFVPALLQGLIFSSLAFYTIGGGDIFWNGRFGVLGCLGVLIIYGITHAWSRKRQ